MIVRRGPTQATIKVQFSVADGEVVNDLFEVASQPNPVGGGVRGVAHNGPKGVSSASYISCLVPSSFHLCLQTIRPAQSATVSNVSAEPFGSSPAASRSSQRRFQAPTCFDAGNQALLEIKQYSDPGLHL